MVKEKPEQPTFSKQAIVESRLFTGYRDLLNGMLADDKRYTLQQVSRILEKFLKRQIK